MARRAHPADGPARVEPLGMPHGLRREAPPACSPSHARPFPLPLLVPAPRRAPTHTHHPPPTHTCTHSTHSCHPVPIPACSYDYMALVPIIQGAGGVVTDWRGQPLRWAVDSQVGGGRRALYSSLSLLICCSGSSVAGKRAGRRHGLPPTPGCQARCLARCCTALRASSAGNCACVQRFAG